MSSENVIIALISGFVGVLIGLLNWTSKRKVDSADATQKINEAALALIQPYQNEVAALREKVACLEARIDVLVHENGVLDEVLAGAYRLYLQVQSLGGMPVYVPPERRADPLKTDEDTRPQRRKVE